MTQRAALLCLLAALAARGAEVTLDPEIVAGRKWAEGATKYREALLDVVNGLKLPEAKPLAKLYAKYALCDLLAKAGGADKMPSDQGHDVVAWLLANPALAGTLALAVEPEDDPVGVLAVLRTLLPKDKDTTVRAPNFYVAFAVVWDRRIRQQGRTRKEDYVPGGRPTKRRTKGNPRPTEELPQDTRLRRLFAHFVGNAKRMRVGLPKLPWQLARFVVDSNVTDPERRWALRVYDRRRDYGPLYGSIAYDIEKSKWKPGAPYTLENIKRWGGVCGDRAYFASNVAKVCGLPSIAIAGPTPSGVGHAWVMMLHGADTGRYRWAIHGGADNTHATYADPQTGTRQTLRDAQLLAKTLSLPADRRLAATAYLRAARLFADDLYAGRILALLEKAARSNPYDTRSWLMLATLMGRKEGTYERAGALYSFLVKKFKAYPEFTRDILRAILPLIPEDDVERRYKFYTATFKIYRDHTDILVGLMMDLADYLRAQGKTRAAVYTYRDIIRRYRKQGHLVLKALDGAEALYRQHGRVRDVVEMYEEMYHIYKEQKDTALFYGKSAFYYRFAKKLQALYVEVGNRRKAAEMARRIARIDKEMQNRERRKRKRGQI